jgi:VIT1/CCC1 family predicted Fe2+/Mn2+ transporter
MPDKKELYLRYIVFGVSDSLVSTVGLLSGIDATGATRQAILMTGIIYAFVEAFSMAIGSFLSEESTEEYEARKEVGDRNAVVAAAVMFVSFVLASFIPIAPYLFLGIAPALWVSMALSVVALFVLGLVSAKFVKVRMAEHAAKMALLGGAAIAIGVIVGKFFK